MEVEREQAADSLENDNLKQRTCGHHAYYVHVFTHVTADCFHVFSYLVSLVLPRDVTVIIVVLEPAVFLLAVVHGRVEVVEELIPKSCKNFVTRSSRI